MRGRLRTALLLAAVAACLALEPPAAAQQCGAEPISEPTQSVAPATTPPRPAPPARSARDATLALVVVLLGAAAAVLARGRLRRTGLRALVRGPWSPYLAGAGLGLAATAALALAGKPLGASGAFAGLAGALGRALAPSSRYFHELSPPLLGFQSWLMIGVLVGAAAAAALQGELALRWLPERGWRERFGGGIARRWVLVFLGTAAVGFGAGLAGGCTSGLAISQGALLSPGAFVFIAAMFASGAPIALWTGRRR